MIDAQGERIHRLARAEELKALAAHAKTPALRVFYLQLADAFRRLAARKTPPERPTRH